MYTALVNLIVPNDVQHVGEGEGSDARVSTGLIGPKRLELQRGPVVPAAVLFSRPQSFMSSGKWLGKIS